MMESQWFRITTPPPSEEEILNSFVSPQYVRCEPRLPLLVNPPDLAFPCVESLDVFEAVNAHVSAQVHTFFNAVRTRQDTNPGEDVECEIKQRAQSGGISKGRDCWHRVFHTRRLTVENPDTLPLLNHVTKLRVLPVLSWKYNNVRPFSPRVPLDLATRLPHLRELECPWLWERLPIPFKSEALRIFSRVWAGPWRDSRAEFARGVAHAMPLLPSSFTKARLWFWEPYSWGDIFDQAMPMPDLCGAADDEFQYMDEKKMRRLSLSSITNKFEGKDPVSLGLRTLGSRLEDLDICALITPDLFPSSSNTTDPSHSWSKMRHLKVEFYPCAPDGRWYFSGPRGEDPYPTGFTITQEEHYPPGLEDEKELHDLLDDEEEANDTGDQLVDVFYPDMFRIVPIAERINPLLLAFAKSIQRDKMPFLQDAELVTWLKWHPTPERYQEYAESNDAPPFDEDGGNYGTDQFRWGVRYDGPREGDGTDGKGKLTFQVGQKWRPGPEVMEAFQELVGWDGVNMEWKDTEFVERRDGF